MRQPVEVSDFRPATFVDSDGLQIQDRIVHNPYSEVPEIHDHRSQNVGPAESLVAQDLGFDVDDLRWNGFFPRGVPFYPVHAADFYLRGADNGRHLRCLLLYSRMCIPAYFRNVGLKLPFLRPIAFATCSSVAPLRLSSFLACRIRIGI